MDLTVSRNQGNNTSVYEIEGKLLDFFEYIICIREKIYSYSYVDKRLRYFLVDIEIPPLNASIS